MRLLATVVAIATAAVLLIACGEAPLTADTDRAPDFTATDGQGHEVTLSGLLDEHAGVVLVFYRGFF